MNSPYQHHVICCGRGGDEEGKSGSESEEEEAEALTQRITDVKLWSLSGSVTGVYVVHGAGALLSQEEECEGVRQGRQ